MAKAMSLMAFACFSACEPARAGNGYLKLKFDSVALYQLCGNMWKSGAVDYFWERWDDVSTYVQSIPPARCARLFSMVDKATNYSTTTESTPGYNFALVFFSVGVKVGYIAVDLRDTYSGSVRFSHDVPVFMKGTVDMTQRGGGKYYTPLNAKGVTSVRQF